MTAAARDDTLQLLGVVPGVVGSLVFDGGGEVLASAFPPVFDAAGLRDLAGRLGADGYFQEWMASPDGALDLRYQDGSVAVRTVDRSWLLVLYTAQANAQLLSMSMTQAIRRLRTGGPLRPAQEAPAPPTPVERLRAAVAEELGDHAAQALEILNAAGAKPKELLRAVADVEKLTRLFIDRKKADELGRRLRAILGK